MTMFKMFFGFIAVAVVGVLAYIRLKFLWNHWIFWLVGSLVFFYLLRLFMSLAVQVSSTTSFTMCHLPEETKKQEKQLSFPEATVSNMGYKDGLFQFLLLLLVCCLYRSL